MSDDFDPTPYVRPPIMDVPSGIALGTALLSASPKSPPSHVRKAEKKLSAALNNLKNAWQQSLSASKTPDKRPADIRADNAWGALFDRLDAYARLPHDEYPAAHRAAQLLTIVFPDGLAFLTSTYNAQWAEAENRLALISAQQLGPELVSIAGPEFFDELQKSHALYGQALGITQPLKSPEPLNLSSPLRALGKAIVQYAIQIVAMFDEAESTQAIVRHALRPIDEHRAAQAEKREPKPDGPPSPSA